MNYKGKPSAPCEDCGARPGEYCDDKCIQDGCKSPKGHKVTKRSILSKHQRMGAAFCAVLMGEVWYTTGSFISGMKAWLVMALCVLILTNVLESRGGKR